MSSTLAAHSYASALNRNELFASFALRDVIPTKVLAPDEEVLLVLPGVGSDFPNLLVVTIHRCMKVQVGGVVRRHRISRQVPPDAVLGSSYGGRSFQRIRVHVRGQRDIAMLPHRNADGLRFQDELAQLIATGRVPGRG